MRWSRWYRAAPPRAEGVSLAEYLSALPIPRALLVPCSDNWVTAIAELEPGLRDRFPACVPPVAVVETLVDKLRFAEAMQAAGVPHPHTEAIGSVADLERVPALVLSGTTFLKPRDSQRFFARFNVKGFRVASRDDAVARLREIEAAGFSVVLQEYVPGPASRHYYVEGFVDVHGVARIWFARRRLRMYPADFGNSTYFASVRLEEVSGATASMEALLAHLHYRGIFSAEFKRDDRDGEFKLLEVNARPWWYVDFAVRAGADVVGAYCRDALGLPVEAVTRYRVGATCMYPYYDYYASRGDGWSVARFGGMGGRPPGYPAACIPVERPVAGCEPRRRHGARQARKLGRGGVRWTRHRIRRVARGGGRMSAVDRPGLEILCSALEATRCAARVRPAGRAERATVRGAPPLPTGGRSAHARTGGELHGRCVLPRLWARRRAGRRSGPGFTYALTGLAEARLDSAAVVHVVGAPAVGPGRTFNLQAIDQRAIVAPLAKRVIEVRSAGEMAGAVAQAHALALDGEPGPVVVELHPEALAGRAPDVVSSVAPTAAAPPDPTAVRRVAMRIRDAHRVVLFVGQGARSAAGAVAQLAERIGAPVATTPSGRGTLPEDHRLALGYDSPRAGPDALNALMLEADAVLVLGAKLGHNGTAGFALRFPADRTVHVDADRAVLGANYEMADVISASTGPFLAALLAEDLGPQAPRGWSPEVLAGWCERMRGQGVQRTEPRVGGTEQGTAAALVGDLRSRLPREAILVTDTGRHQGLVRRYYDVLAPGGLLMPSDLQSMGFGLPAAIAAKLAAPQRPVVAVIGDGGFLMSGLELATAVREGLALTVVVFADGAYGQIRDHQLLDYGHAHGVSVGRVPVEGLARALGCDFFPFESMPAERWAEPRGVTVVEVPVGDSFGMQRARAVAVAREATRGVLGPAVMQQVKRWLGRG